MYKIEEKMFLLKLARFSVGLVVQRLAGHTMLLSVTFDPFVFLFLLFSPLVILVCFPKFPLNLFSVCVS